MPFTLYSPYSTSFMIAALKNRFIFLIFDDDQWKWRIYRWIMIQLGLVGQSPNDRSLKFCRVGDIFWIFLTIPRPLFPFCHSHCLSIPPCPTYTMIVIPSIGECSQNCWAFLYSHRQCRHMLWIPTYIRPNIHSDSVVALLYLINYWKYTPIPSPIAFS